MAIQRVNIRAPTQLGTFLQLLLIMAAHAKTLAALLVVLFFTLDTGWSCARPHWQHPARRLHLSLFQPLALFSPPCPPLSQPGEFRGGWSRLRRRRRGIDPRVYVCASAKGFLQHQRKVLFVLFRANARSFFALPRENRELLPPPLRWSFAPGLYNKYAAATFFAPPVFLICLSAQKRFYGIPLAEIRVVCLPQWTLDLLHFVGAIKTSGLFSNLKFLCYTIWIKTWYLNQMLKCHWNIFKL